MRKYQTISAEGHVEVPTDAWAARVPEKYRAMLPRLVRQENGGEQWQLLDARLDPTFDLVCDVGGRLQPDRTRAYRKADGSPQPGCGDAVQRLREQDADGVDAEVLYPPVYMGAFFRPVLKRDRDAYNAIVQAYNSFLAEDYCKAAPDRLIGVGIVPESGLDEAIQETQRCRKMGLRAVCLTKWPHGGDAREPEDDRFFAAALDLDARLTAEHTFGGADDRLTDVPGISRLNTMMSPSVIGPAHPIAQAALYGVFQRFPRLRFYFAGTQAGWLPFYLQQTDEYSQRWYAFHKVTLAKVPSNYYRDHCRFGFNTDEMAVRYRHYAGIDLLMWGSAFPRSIGSAPHSRKTLSNLFADVPPAERRQMLVENACAFFGLDPAQELTPTP